MAVEDLSFVQQRLALLLAVWATAGLLAVAGCRAAPADVQPAATSELPALTSAQLVPTPAPSPRPFTRSSAPPANPTRPPVNQEPASGPLSQLGSGSARTQAFRLPAGQYFINWTARPLLPSGIGCTLRGVLRSTGSQEVRFVFEGQVVPGEGLFSGVTSAFNLSSGEYLLEMSSDCMWEVTVLPTQPSAPSSTATLAEPTRGAAATTVPSSPSATALQVVIIHFARLSQPVDAEALNTQVGPLPGVVTLEIGVDTATIGYDPQRATCDGLADTIRSLGFSVRSYECGARANGVK